MENKCLPSVYSMNKLYLKLNRQYVCPIRNNEVRLLGFMRAVRSERLKLKYNIDDYFYIFGFFFSFVGGGGGG